MKDFTKIVFKQFIEENWSAFVFHCNERGVEAGHVKQPIGGE